MKLLMHLYWEPVPEVKDLVIHFKGDSTTEGIVTLHSTG